MRVYLDNCTFNRPFDDQTQIRIRIETEAKLFIQEQIRTGTLELIWSYVLDFEISKNPFMDRRQSVQAWQKLARWDIDAADEILDAARALERSGLRFFDSLHLAAAATGKANFFVTTDDEILKKLKLYEDVVVLSPTEFVIEFTRNDA